MTTDSSGADSFGALDAPAKYVVAVSTGSQTPAFLVDSQALRISRGEHPGARFRDRGMSFRLVAHTPSIGAAPGDSVIARIQVFNHGSSDAVTPSPSCASPTTR